MSDKVLSIETLEQLKQFLNENNILEIALRGQKKKFSAFQKVMINNLGEGKEKELAQKVVHALNKNTQLNERNMRLLSNVAQLEKIGLLLNGLNLCSTCAGFAIMNAKLDELSSEINNQLNQLQKTVKQTQDIQNDYEFNKVLAEHTDMLDGQRRQKPYSEGEMRDLVDSEYNVLKLLLNSFQKDISGDHSALIFSIFSMLDMFTVSLKTFDEMYYFNNRLDLGGEDPWHPSHVKWMSVYDTLSSKWVVERLQDYGIFETKLSTQEVDIYYISLLDQVSDLRKEIEDNQALIIAFGDVELFRQYKEMSEMEVLDSIETEYWKAGSDMDEETVRKAYQNAIQQAAMA